MSVDGSDITSVPATWPRCFSTVNGRLQSPPPQLVTPQNASPQKYSKGRGTLDQIWPAALVDAAGVWCCAR
jgi:hypothetical protein